MAFDVSEIQQISRLEHVRSFWASSLDDITDSRINREQASAGCIGSAVPGLPEGLETQSRITRPPIFGRSFDWNKVFSSSLVIWHPCFARTSGICDKTVSYLKDLYPSELSATADDIWNSVSLSNDVSSSSLWWT
jgi:hypothetical protein